MKIQVQSVHFDADSKLLAFIENKVNRLSKFFDNIIEAEVFLRLQDSGGKVQDKIAEIKLLIPGAVLIDKKISSSFENAVLVSVDSLKRQVINQKEKALEKRQQFLRDTFDKTDQVS
jgi:putative sigma-54 modulation protein